MSPLLRLETLGVLALPVPPGTEPVTQPRRLALLALLAAAGTRGLSRDKVLAYLWPESSAEKGRHALEQTLYEVRRQLGNAILAGHGPLRLNPDVIGSDLAEFRHAFGSGRLAEAASLHHGPFCDGFFLSDVPEFERWIEATRAELGRDCLVALDRLIGASYSRPESAAKVGWCRQAASMEPYNASRVIALMQVLAAVGAPELAIQEAHQYQDRVRKDLEEQPDPAVIEMAQQLRRSARSASGDVIAVGSDSVAPASQGEPLARRILPQKPPLRRLTTAAALLVGAAIAVGGIGAVVGRRPAPHASVPPNPIRTFIAPFRVTAPDSTLAFLREGAVDFLAAQLGGADGLDAVDPRTALSAWHSLVRRSRDSGAVAARRAALAVGAGQVLLGDVIQTGFDSIVVTGTLSNTATGRLLSRASVSGAPDSVFGLLDALALQLLGGTRRYDSIALQLRRTPREAVRFYLTGETLVRRGAFGPAEVAFQRALEQDSAFLPAAVGLAVASLWTGHFLVQPAWASRHRLSSADRALVEAIAGPRYPETPGERETLLSWQRAVEAGPNRAIAWFGLGDRYWRMGASLGVVDWQDQARRAFGRCLALDSSMVRAVDGLIRLAAEAGDTASVRSLAVSMRSIGHWAGDPVLEYMEWLVMGSLSGNSRFRYPDLRTLSRHALYSIAVSGPRLGWGLTDGFQAAVLFERSASRDHERFEALGFLLDYAVNFGRPAEARQIVETMRRLPVAPDMRHALDRRLIRDGMYGGGDSGLASAAVRQVQARTGLPQASDQLTAAEQFRDRCVLGEWAVWQGDFENGRKHLEELRARVAAEDRLTRWHNEKCSALLSAALAVRQRRPDWSRELAVMDSILLVGHPPFSETEHFWLAEARLYQAAGLLPEARNRVNRGGRELRYLPSYLRAEAELAEQAGDTAAAVRSRNRLLQWRVIGISQQTGGIPPSTLSGF